MLVGSPIMGALDEEHFHGEVENEVKLGGGCVIELNNVDEEPDTLAIEAAVRILLEGLGEDINREGIKKTPLRVAKALREGTRGYRQKVNDIVHGALFPESGLENGIGQAGGSGGLVIVRDLDLFSYCESCMLPFQIKCHVGYIPSGKRVVGLSKLSRVADIFAKRLQDPQRLANEICTALQQGIKPSGVAIILQCFHIHFPNIESAYLESNHQGLKKILVTSGSGSFEDEKADIWMDFLSLVRFRGLDINKIVTRGSSSEEETWCPSYNISKIGSGKLELMSAVTSMIRSLGEDPSREELLYTPARFVKWLLNFTNSNIEMKLNGFVLNRKDSSKSTEEQLCSELNLSFWSMCEHHLLPFHGVVHIGYYCGEVASNSIKKSLLQNIVHFYGFKLQVQERLTRQIAETVSSFLGEDVMVVIEANHTCMISRGIEKFGSNTATIAVLGRFANDHSSRAAFLQSIPNSSRNEICCGM